jgi:hypothetical protein
VGAWEANGKDPVHLCFQFKAMKYAKLLFFFPSQALIKMTDKMNFKSPNSLLKAKEG